MLKLWTPTKESTMSVITVATDDGREVETFTVGEGAGNATWRDLLGRYDAPMGWLGRALRDAEVIQGGGDPERLSEKAMRLSTARGGDRVDRDD
jgi:hypothetical protein